MVACFQSLSRMLIRSIVQSSYSRSVFEADTPLIPQLLAVSQTPTTPEPLSLRYLPGYSSLTSTPVALGPTTLQPWWIARTDGISASCLTQLPKILRYTEFTRLRGHFYTNKPADGHLSI